MAPLLSIVVPTRDRAALLARALDALACHSDPARLADVIVVDNGSGDDTATTCRDAARRHPHHPWRYVREPIPGLLSGRHRGAAEARGDVLCYLDDDALIQPGWCEAVLEGFTDPSVSLLGGPSRPSYEQPPPAWLEHLWRTIDGGRMLDSLSLIDCGPRPRVVEPYFVWGLNFSIRRGVLHECGGFHPDGVPARLLRFRGDGEGGLAYKLAERGLQALYHPGALVHHWLGAERLTLEALEQRAFAQGISDSYTVIRQAGAVPTTVASPVAEDRRAQGLREAVRDSGAAEALHELLGAARAAGRRFHESEVRRDPDLLAWVLRPDYFDYRLPAGGDAA